MAMGRRGKKQQSMWLAGTKLARGPRNVFYEKLNKQLARVSFDEQVESWCAPYYEVTGIGRPSIPPGTYFRMLFVGFFEGIGAERAICWRCSDSLSLKRYLGYEPHEETPEHSTLSRIRSRLPSEIYEQVFDLVLLLVGKSGLLPGKTVSVDSTVLQADASMKAIVRRDSGESYQQYLAELARESGLESPSADDLRRLDRKRKGKKTSNKDWKSPTDEDARIARMKDGRTRLAYKAEHVVDMDSGVIVGAELFPADSGDTITMQDSLDGARANLDRVRAALEDEEAAASSDNDDNDHDDDDRGPGGGLASLTDTPIEVVADKGYQKAALLRELKEEGWRTFIPERKCKGKRRWKSRPDGAAESRAFHENRARTKRKKGKALQRKRGEMCERSMAHCYETGGRRRLRLRGHENARKTYLIHSAGFNLARIMRELCGSGTPRGFADRSRAAIEAALAALVALRAPLAVLTALEDFAGRICRALGRSAVARLPRDHVRSLTELVA